MYATILYGCMQECVHSCIVIVVICFRDLMFCLSSQLKAASCARCGSEMPPLKQVNGHALRVYM